MQDMILLKLILTNIEGIFWKAIVDARDIFEKSNMMLLTYCIDSKETILMKSNIFHERNEM
jgi:hypothetical protein